MTDEDTGDLKRAAEELRRAVADVRDIRGVWNTPPLPASPVSSEGWNFNTFEKFIGQRFADLSLQLRERYEAQQTGVIAALAAAEKAVNAALIAAEKAVDKAEGAQQLRNEAQNEFRKSLSDLSGLMWTIKEGTSAIDSLRRETALNTEALRREYLTGHQPLVDRITNLEKGSSNIQGRMWAISAVWAVLVLAVSVGVRFIK